MTENGYDPERITEYVSGGLPEAERAEFERRLAESEELKREVEFWRTVSELTEESMEEAPKALRGSVMAAVKREKRRRRIFPAAGLVAASLVVVLSVHLFAFGGMGSGGPESAESAPYVMTVYGGEQTGGSENGDGSGIMSSLYQDGTYNYGGAAGADSAEPPETVENGKYAVGEKERVEQGDVLPAESPVLVEPGDAVNYTTAGTAVPLVNNGSLAIEPSSVKELRFTDEGGESEPEETLVFTEDAEEETEYFVSLVLVPVDEYGVQDGEATVTYVPAVTGTIEGLTEVTEETEPSGETSAVVSNIESGDGVSFTTVTVVFTDDSTVSFKYSADGYIVADDIWYTFAKPEDRR